MLKVLTNKRPQSYNFLITEVYSQPKELYISYHTTLPADAVEVFEQGREVVISVDPEAIPGYNQKSPDEVMVYPLEEKNESD